MPRFLFLSAILLFMYSPATFSQSTGVSAERILYDSIFQYDLQVIDGRAHSAKYPTGMGHPFFLNSEPVPGTIYINGRVFRHSFVRYDLLNDLLQIYHFTSSGPQVIDLNKNKIEAFNIKGHQFRNYTGSRMPGIFQSEGFYEEKYNGQLLYLVRLQKTYRNNVSGSEGNYEEHTYRYIMTSHGWFRITNRRSLLKAFEENQEEIKEYIRKSQIIIKLAEDEEIINLIKYYESITK